MMFGLVLHCKNGSGESWWAVVVGKEVLVGVDGLVVRAANY